MVTEAANNDRLAEENQKLREQIEDERRKQSEIALEKQVALERSQAEAENARLKAQLQTEIATTEHLQAQLEPAAETAPEEIVPPVIAAPASNGSAKVKE